MKVEEEAWLKSWREKNEPAHKELLTELKPKYLLEHQTKMEKHKEEMLIKKEHLVSSIETRVTTTLTTITKHLGLEKDTHTNDHEIKRLQTIKKHEEELAQLREQINKLEKSPSHVKDHYKKTTEKEVHELKEVFKKKIHEAKAKYEHYKKIYKEIKHRLE